MTDAREYDNDNERKGAVAISSLSDTQLIHILQQVVDDEGLTLFIEAEIARRRIAGGALQ
jgi:hypothetical protein